MGGCFRYMMKAMRKMSPKHLLKINNNKINFFHSPLFSHLNPKKTIQKHFGELKLDTENININYTHKHTEKHATKQSFCSKKKFNLNLNFFFFKNQRYQKSCFFLFRSVQIIKHQKSSTTTTNIEQYEKCLNLFAKSVDIIIINKI